MGSLLLLTSASTNTPTDKTMQLYWNNDTHTHTLTVTQLTVIYCYKQLKFFLFESSLLVLNIMHMNRRREDITTAACERYEREIVKREHKKELMGTETEAWVGQ